MTIGCDIFFFFQAEDGIRDLVRSRGLGDVYKRQIHINGTIWAAMLCELQTEIGRIETDNILLQSIYSCLLYTSDAADERSSVDLGGRRIIKKKKK